MLKQNKSKFYQSFLLFFKGIMMGLADVVPGVSGGTIAFITGIYTRLIHSLSTIDFSFIIMFLKGEFKKSSTTFRKIDFPFFVPLGLGIIFAIITLSKVILYLLESFTALTFAFFFGLILASALFVFKRVGKITFEKIIFLGLGFVFAYALAGFRELAVNHSLPIIFLAGMVAICAMLLPGISGAFILLLLNQYQYLISAIHDFNFSVVGTFSIGALVGLLSFSKLLDHLLRLYKFLTLSFLIGLMLGALRVPINKIIEVNFSLGMVIVSGLVGFGLILILEQFYPLEK
tara:strand:+ start:897 stop:1763 length:867 start_codon:yes stop_codon:yes gene_type:complete